MDNRNNNFAYYYVYVFSFGVVVRLGDHVGYRIPIVDVTKRCNSEPFPYASKNGFAASCLDDACAGFTRRHGYSTCICLNSYRCLDMFRA